MNEKQEKLKANLWRCDCADEATHTQASYHQSACNYAMWVLDNIETIETGDENEEE